MKELDEITGMIVETALKTHKELGPGAGKVGTPAYRQSTVPLRVSA